MAEKFLVTGGAGFIGSHISKRLLDEGHEVVIADNLLTGSMENVPEGAKFIYIDLANENHYYKLDWFCPKAILHIAGQSSGEISHESPVSDLDINTKATILLGNWSRKQHCNRILFTSSVSVYGDGVAPGKPMSEIDEPLPKSFYGCSKLSSEYYLRVFNQSYEVNATSFRLFNVYGPGQNMQNMKQGIISIYLSFVLFQECLLVKGSLERYRDFVYISDVVDLMVSSIGDERTFNKIFNVGTGRKVLIRDLIDLILKTTGKSDFPVEVGEGTPGDTFGSIADVSNIKEMLCWEAKVSLEQGITEMVKFYVSG
ncbi:MAG: NAD-dependent epimerase/dehydratase family protein [bacterium]|nr:MAG: NAD-dependent epimerase/dehydratase family protein [bacterium]